MHNALSRLRFAFLTLAGATLGLAYGQYRVALLVARMKERWGWVCGTGLDLQLAFWSVVGAIAGLLTVLALAFARSFWRWHQSSARKDMVCK